MHESDQLCSWAGEVVRQHIRSAYCLLSAASLPETAQLQNSTLMPLERAGPDSSIAPQTMYTCCLNCFLSRQSTDPSLLHGAGFWGQWCGLPSGTREKHWMDWMKLTSLGLVDGVLDGPRICLLLNNLFLHRREYAHFPCAK